MSKYSCSKYSVVYTMAVSCPVCPIMFQGHQPLIQICRDPYFGIWPRRLFTGAISAVVQWLCHVTKHAIQESPAVADKPARRESLPKLLKFGVPTTLSLTILAYLHAFNCYCVRNPRNPEKFTENSNLCSRSSKVTDLGANRKPICDLLLVINSNFSRICFRFRDIHG